MAFHDSSVQNRFRNAVETLATRAGTIQERLAAAYCEQLLPLRLEDLPEELRELLGSIDVYLTRNRAKGAEGNVAATVSRLSDEGARKIASTIVDLSYKLEQWEE